MRWLGYCIALFVIIAATAVSIGQLLSPYLNERRADFEKWASAWLQVPITIHKITVSWRLAEPELAFGQVAVLDQKTHRPIVEIRKLKVNLSIIQSVLQRKPIPESIKIDGVRLTLYQKKSGQLQVPGLNNFVFTDNVTGAAVPGNAMSAWIFSQPHLSLRNIDIQFIPEEGLKRSVTLIALSLHNTRTEHTLTGKATLNQTIPTQIVMDLQWHGDTFDIMHNTSHAQLYLELEDVSLSQWMGERNWKNLQIKQGIGSGKCWITWEHGQLQKIHNQFQLYEMQLQSLLTKKKVVIPHLSGHVSWQRDGDRQSITGEDILIDFPKHVWPVTQFSLLLFPENKMTLQVGYLDLSDASALALASGLLPEKMQKFFLVINPTGEVRSLKVQSNDWSKPENNIYSAEFSNLTLNAWQTWPGMTNMSGVFSWDGKQGQCTLSGQQSILTFHSLFEKPLQFDTVSGLIQWQQDPAHTWLINTKNFQVSNSDITIKTDMTVALPQNAFPILNIASTFSIPRVAQIENYLPIKMLDPSFVDWFHNRFQDGQVDSGKAIVQGKLSDFPFDHGAGKFLISATVKDLEFEYAPGWPTIHHVYGKLVFSGNAMIADMESGQLFNVPLTKVHGSIPYIGPAHPQILNLRVIVNQAYLSQGLRFIQESPLRETIGKDLEGMQLAGKMGLDLAFTIPVKTPEKTKVKGDVKISSATLQLPNWNLTLDRMTGILHFTEQAIDTTQMQGKLFNEPIQLTINTVRAPNMPPVVKAILRGELALPTLQNWLKMPFPSFIKGKTAYTAELDMVSHQYPKPSQLLIHSDLTGVTIHLMEPYSKKVDEPRAFQLLADFKKGQPLQTKITYGALLTAALTYAPSTQGWQFKSGEMHLGSDGVAHWQTEPGLLVTGQIHMAGIDTSGQVWLPINVPQSIIHAKLSHLYLTPTDRELSLDPKTIPAFSFIGDDVRFRDQPLGHITLDVAPSKTGLQIQQLEMTMGFAKLNAQGEWSSQNNKNQTHLQGTLTAKNTTQLLDHFGLGSSNVVVDDGHAEFNLVWSDVPYKVALTSMTGHIGLKMGKGRVINLGSSTNAKVGFGRMLNIVSLQTLPRRLSLDFTDLFEKGYSFDVMQGYFTLKNGNAVTQDTYFDGPIARIEMKGRVGLALKDYDLILSVTPYVTGSIPIVATLAGGPIVGAVTWLVEKVASSAVSKVTTYRYVITGPWDNPVWEKI